MPVLWVEVRYLVTAVFHAEILKHAAADSNKCGQGCNISGDAVCVNRCAPMTCGIESLLRGTAGCHWEATALEAVHIM